ncbi:hypothetical protein JCGZ_25774 [Jatropha curcas]|uniref:Uncharacterized protein n=1 Tax=Jatropha curcas TaxID=180498 RepID=A0A067JJN9_JATCU|nr:uncharacterized protein LOC105646926 [Jatropha curcas]KDP24117.1 hypothetical protein JCGZ_25774 [Jatropha curcas]
MAKVLTGKPLMSDWDCRKIIEFSDQQVSFSDVVFGFLEEEEEESPKISCNSIDYIEDDEDNSCTVEGNRKFWETQNELLKATLYRTSSFETKIRQTTKDAIREIKQLGLHCRCHNPATGECRNCLRKEISLRLRTKGYNCAICKSKWKSSQEIPSGEHTYLEVIEKLSSKKGEVRVVIELNFRAEFEIARASEDYNQLMNNLPEIFIGKAERLKALIKILCSAGKMCMKEKKMHLGPWRKHKYMQSKWLGTCERTTVPAVPLPVGYSDRPAKPRASMLTYDLLDTLPVLHYYS